MVFNVPRIEIVPDLGSTPARVNRRTGTVYISKRVFEPLSERERNFVLAHEEGHYRLNTCDETKADEYAFKKYAGTEPFSLKNTLKILRDTLDTENNPGHRRRLIQLQKAVLKYDAKVYGNKKAQALLDRMETENFDGKMAQENISEIIRNLQVDYLKQLGINDVNALTQEQKTGLLYSFMKTPQMQYVLKKKTDNAVTEYCGYADDPDFLEAYEAYSNEFCNFGKRKERKKAKAEKKAAKKAAKAKKKLQKKIAKAKKKGNTAKIEKLQQKLNKKLDKIEKKKEKKIENADKTFFQKVGNVAKNVAKVSAKVTKIATKVAAPIVSAAATAFGMPGVGNVVAKIAEKANPFELIGNLKNKNTTAVVSADDDGVTVIGTQNLENMSKKDKKAAKKAAKAEKKAAKKEAKQAKKEAKRQAKAEKGGGIIKRATTSAKNFVINQAENIKEAVSDLMTNQNPITPEEVEAGKANPELMSAGSTGAGANTGNVTGAGSGAGNGASNAGAAPMNSNPQDTEDKTPIYKQWWFWLIIAAVVGGGIYFVTRKKN